MLVSAVGLRFVSVARAKTVAEETMGLSNRHGDCAMIYG